MNKAERWLPLAFTVITIALVLCSCAPALKPDPTSARELVASAYASGASRLAVSEYQAAAMALRNAERQILAEENALAYESLRLARKFALDALLATEREKQRRLDLARQREQEQKEIQPVVIKPVPVKIAPPRPVVPASPSTPRLVDQVEVREGETLSDISSRGEVYGDPMLWPLVYRANRDQIKDPMKIFPGQILVIPRDKTDEEKHSAREEARTSELFR